MKTLDKHKEFIKLRAQGFSFDKISDKIGVSKPILVEWDKKYKNEILEMKQAELDALREEYFITRKAQLEICGNIQKRLVEEANRRDFSKLSDKDLMELILKYQDKIRNLIEDFQDSSDKSASKSESNSMNYFDFKGYNPTKEFDEWLYKVRNESNI